MCPLVALDGRYEIKSRIGQGGMGELYLARDPNTNRLMALKLLNATLDSDEIRERFAREARALAALNHPNSTIIGVSIGVAVGALVAALLAFFMRHCVVRG